MTVSFIADLHNHSTASDGEYSPTELVTRAHDLGLHALALTDHDTLAGLDEAKEAARIFGLLLIPGVEVTLRFRRLSFVGSLHLLLYFSDDLLTDPAFRDTLTGIMSQGRGEALVRDRVTAINAVFGPDSAHPALQRPLTREEVSAYSSNITRRHFALALKEKHGIQDGDQVNAIIGNHSPAYIPSGIDMRLLPPLCAAFPVVRVFAHPAAGSFPRPSHYREVLPPLEVVEELWPEFLDPELLGLDGLEVHYPGHTLEHRGLLLDWADRDGLLVTGGSDCHDTVQRPLGVAGMTQTELDRLLAKMGSVR